MKSHRAFVVWLVSTIAIMLFAFWIGEATAGEFPISCTSYGRIVECNVLNPQNQPLVWSAEKTEGEKPIKDNAPYKSGGENFSYRLKDNAEYTIELHVIDSSLRENRIFRYQVQWGKDPTDGVWKPLFKNPGIKLADSKTSPSTTKQASKEK